MWPWALGAALLAAALVGGWCTWRAPPPSAAGAPGAPGAPGTAERLIGVWVAPVRYGWGARHDERFEFKRHAGEITGSAGFLGYPRAIEQLRIEGSNIHFQTHSQTSMGNETREETHAYAIELRGQPPHEVLAVRLHSSGGFGSEKPLEFEAQRAP